MTKHTPATPQDFTTKFPRYVYRSHKGRESVQWREAALDMYDERAKLVEALRDSLPMLRACKRDHTVSAILRELGEDE
jgi:hypothetical protein